MLDRASQDPQADDSAARLRPVAFRGGGFAPAAGRYSGWIALAIVIALWQLAGSAGWVNPLFLPAPSAIAVAIYRLAISGALWHHLSWSIMRIGTGWVLGTTVASSSVLRSGSRVLRAASASPSSRRCFRFQRLRCCRC